MIFPDTICTYTGRSIRPLDPHVDDIVIEDIAHSLSMQCRFLGHRRRFYSVAEHSIYVARLVPPAQRLQALLHDASEAYLMDLVSPLKRLPMFAEYRAAEERLMTVIGMALGFDPEMTPEIKLADHQMLQIEERELGHKDDGIPDTQRHIGRYQCRLGNVEVKFLNLYDEFKRGARRLHAVEA